MVPVAWFDPAYPALLNCIPDPPPVLWTRGDLAVLSLPAVAIVGSRAATPYALDVAARLAGELAARGVAVVSGLARGVDSAAHRGTLEANGPTIAVLGSGLDRVYPAEHRGLADTISRSGVVMSELAPGGLPLAEHFPLRNRIISGLSLAVVVVEASEKSGSLITARCAMEQGRDVMAVPGSVLSGRNRGSHSLLKDGAKVVESADDILEELGWPAARPRESAPQPGGVRGPAPRAHGARRGLRTGCTRDRNRNGAVQAASTIDGARASRLRQGSGRPVWTGSRSHPARVTPNTAAREPTPARGRMIWSEGEPR